MQRRHPQLVRAFTTEGIDELVAWRGVHPEEEALLERTDRSMRLRAAFSLDADRHELAEVSRARMTQKEETRAITGPGESRHSILVLRRERPAAADRDVTHDDLARIGSSSDPTTVARESHGIQSDGQGGFLPTFEITYSRVLHDAVVHR